MNEFKYRLDTFEGPLDLLLTLIKKNKVSIWDIPIVELTDQYLEAISGIEKTMLDNTGEFIILASELLYIKSKMLLPRDEDDEDEGDPREELAQRLYEYKKFKEASHNMRKSEFSSKYMVFRGEEDIELPIPEYNRSHAISELVDAFGNIYQRRIRHAKPEKRAFYGIVGREKVSVDDMVTKIENILKISRQVEFSSLFKEEDSRPEMIATFLAILEMIKLNRIYADYNDKKKEFIICSAEKMPQED